MARRIQESIYYQLLLLLLGSYFYFQVKGYKQLVRLSEEIKQKHIIVSGFLKGAGRNPSRRVLSLSREQCCGTVAPSSCSSLFVATNCKDGASKPSPSSSPDLSPLQPPTIRRQDPKSYQISSLYFNSLLILILTSRFTISILLFLRRVLNF